MNMRLPIQIRHKASGVCYDITRIELVVNNLVSLIAYWDHQNHSTECIKHSFGSWEFVPLPTAGVQPAPEAPISPELEFVREAYAELQVTAAHMPVVKAGDPHANAAAVYLLRDTSVTNLLALIFGFWPWPSNPPRLPTRYKQTNENRLRELREAAGHLLTAIKYHLDMEGKKDIEGVDLSDVLEPTSDATE